MSDLTNLTNLDNQDAYNYLTTGKRFRLTTEQEIDGNQVQEYRDTKAAATNSEKVTVGMGTKGADGLMLRKVLYTTNQQKNVQGLMNQAFDSKMNLTFRGGDQRKYIYVYNSYLYIVSVYIFRDRSSAMVEVKQKDLPSY